MIRFDQALFTLALRDRLNDTLFQLLQYETALLYNTYNDCTADNSINEK
jgi:hypothetical protein